MVFLSEVLLLNAYSRGPDQIPFFVVSLFAKIPLRILGIIDIPINLKIFDVHRPTVDSLF